MIQKMKKSKGFTLIEMLVVIAIIAILVAIIVPVVGNSTAKAKAAADAANLRSIATTVAVDYLDNNEINSTSTAPECKTDSDGVLEVWLISGNVEAFYKYDNAYYGVDYYSDVATNGKATENKTYKVPTASTDKQLAIETDSTLAKVTTTG